MPPWGGESNHHSGVFDFRPPANTPEVVQATRNA